MPRSRPRATFQPLQRAPSAKRRFAVLAGAAIWFVALVALAVVVRRRDSVEIALLVVAASIVLGLTASSLLRRARVRRERAA